MIEEIKQIKELLDKIEQTKNNENEKSFKESFELFELPEIIKSIVDYLQPLLSPYEAAIYWYMFRHSIIEIGDVFVRVSTRGLGSNVVMSASGKSVSLSYGKVQDTLIELENKGTIKKVGDTNRNGTLYQVLIPDEIEICKENMKKAQLESLPKIDPKKELDFYNIKENRLKIFERDEYKCYSCGKILTRFSATLDHIDPVSKGGDNSYENLITCCLHCNSKRINKPIMENLVENN
jgi:DNA-directed RNA polymerase subunit RPC12/RpoP